MLDRKGVSAASGMAGPEHREADNRDRQGSPLETTLRLLMELGRGLDWLKQGLLDK